MESICNEASMELMVHWTPKEASMTCFGLIEGSSEKPLCLINYSHLI